MNGINSRLARFLIWDSLCEADHAVFIRQWSTPPQFSITMPPLGRELFFFVPIHVDDSLVICNSLLLYNWFVVEVSNLFVWDQYLTHDILVTR